MKTNLAKLVTPKLDQVTFTKFDLINYTFGIIFILLAIITKNLNTRIFCIGLSISSGLCIFSTRPNVILMALLNILGTLIILSGILQVENLLPNMINYTGVTCIAGGYLFVLGAIIREQFITSTTKLMVFFGGCAIAIGVILLGQPLESSILLIFFFSAITIGPGSFFAYFASKLTHTGLFLE